MRLLKILNLTEVTIDFVSCFQICFNLVFVCSLHFLLGQLEFSKYSQCVQRFWSNNQANQFDLYAKKHSKWSSLLFILWNFNCRFFAVQHQACSYWQSHFKGGQLWRILFFQTQGCNIKSFISKNNFYPCLSCLALGIGQLCPYQIWYRKKCHCNGEKHYGVNSKLIFYQWSFYELKVILLMS